jgi:hypothetical protein
MKYGYPGSHNASVFNILILYVIVTVYFVNFGSGDAIIAEQLRGSIHNFWGWFCHLYSSRSAIEQ